MKKISCFVVVVVVVVVVFEGFQEDSKGIYKFAAIKAPS